MYHLLLALSHWTMHLQSASFRLTLLVLSFSNCLRYCCCCCFCPLVYVSGRRLLNALCGAYQFVSSGVLGDKILFFVADLLVVVVDWLSCALVLLMGSPAWTDLFRVLLVCWLGSSLLPAISIKTWQPSVELWCDETEYSMAGQWYEKRPLLV